MTLREELEDRADKLDAELLDLSGRIKEIERQSNELHTCLNALDIAEMDAEDEAREWAEAESLPVTDEQPELFEAEKSEAREQLEREDDASEFAAPMPDAEFVVLDEQTCEPVEEAPALNADMQDEREQPYRIIADVDDKPLTIDFETFYDATECMEELKLRSTSNAELSVLHEGENGEQERVTLSSFAEAEPQPDGYAPVTDAWIETTPGTLAEYVPTNPEADERAKLADYYSPENVEKRNRFNPWGGVAHLFGKPKVDA